MSEKKNKYKVFPTNQYKNDLKLAKKQGKNLDKLDKIIDLLLAGEELEPKYKDHKLKGNFEGYRECHIEPDWLLIYKIVEDMLILSLSRVGTHSELFKK